MPVVSCHVVAAAAGFDRIAGRPGHQVAGFSVIWSWTPQSATIDRGSPGRGSNMSIETRLQAFITATDNAALVLRGEWGQGKTYFWTELAKNHAAKGKEERPNYAYISLFGVNSLADMRNMLAVKLRPVEQIQEDTFMALWTGDKTGMVGRLKTKVLSESRSFASKAAELGVNVKHVSNLGPLYLAFAYTSVKKALICIDDIERRGKGLDIKEVLGLISDLVYQRECSVIAILNDRTLDEDDQKIWNDNREKVFMGELRLLATCSEATSRVYKLNGRSNYDDDEKVAMQAIKELDIKNIRIIQRIKAAIDNVLPQLSKDTLADTREVIIRGLALIVYCHAGQGSGAPPPWMMFGDQFARDLVTASEKLDGKEQKKTPEEKAWGELLRHYRYFIGNRLDELLNQTVLDGYCDEDEFQKAVRVYEDELLRGRRETALTKAWRLYQETTGDNAAEVVAAMHQGFIAAIDEIAAHNVDPIVRLFRRLGEEEKANHMIKDWIDLRRGDRWKELEPKTVGMFRDLEDKPFKIAIEAAYDEWLAKSLPAFEDIMARVSQGETSTDEVIDGLAHAGVEDYVSYFKGNGVGKAKPLLNLSIERNIKSKKVHSTVWEALDLIKAGSVIDRLRVEDLVDNFTAYDRSGTSDDDLDEDDDPDVGPNQRQSDD
jgi:hypothetical protein